MDCNCSRPFELVCEHTETTDESARRWMLGLEGPQEKIRVKWKVATTFLLAIASALTPAVACAQLDTLQTPSLTAGLNSGDDALPDAPQSASQQNSQSNPPAPAAQPAAAAPQENKQTKRILYIVPNFRAVTTGQKLPPQTVKEKFMTAALDSVDYSSLIFVGIQAGIGQASDSYPEFRQGAAGYGRYYWHTFADDTDENLWVEFLLPVALRQDSRYYTLGHGGLPKRFVYSFSRIFITRQDSGHETFNASEIFGAGTAAGISNLYYPSQERTFTKTYQRWITNLTIDGGTFVFKEFWPDLNNKFFHQTD
jgi:hypothetical protein